MAKMNEREFMTKVLAMNGISADLIEYAEGAIAKLDAKNEKRKTTQTKVQKENEPIEKAILDALAEGQKLAVDLATIVGCSVNKVNGIGLNLVNKGRLVKTKVKVKGKGDMTAYSLVVTVEDNGDEDGEGEE